MILDTTSGILLEKHKVSSCENTPILYPVAPPQLCLDTAGGYTPGVHSSFSAWLGDSGVVSLALPPLGQVSPSGRDDGGGAAGSDGEDGGGDERNGGDDCEGDDNGNTGDGGGGRGASGGGVDEGVGDGDDCSDEGGW